MHGAKITVRDEKTGRVTTYDYSSPGEDLIGSLVRAQREISEQIREADANTNRLLTAIDNYIARRDKQGDYFSWPALFLPAGRSVFGGYSKQAKLDAARYLKAMVLHFRVVDKGEILLKGTSLDPITAIGTRVGPLMDGELSGYFERYRDCSGDHYLRYQHATSTGKFEEIPAPAAVASAPMVSL